MYFIGKSDLSLIFKELGKVMIGVGIVMLLPILVALIYNEDFHFLSYFLPSIFSLTIGFAFKNTLKSNEKIQLKHAMILAAFAWLWACLIGSLAMMFYLDLPFIDAFFENMSAWTTTGLTIFPNVEILPKSILFLRSLEQWLGGLGVVILVIGFLVHSGTDASRLYRSEAHQDRILPSIVNTVKSIWLIYILFTVLGIILYVIAGMPLFDAINHTMTSISTGGMSVKNLSIGFYNNIFINLITIFLMIMGAISFFVHYKLFTGNIKEALNNRILQGLFLIIIFSSLVNSLITKIPFVDGLFYMTSAVTCTGSTLESLKAFQTWPQISFIFLIILMVIGGCSGSTSGAIKIDRLVKFIKGAYWEILHVSLPEKAVIKSKLLGKKIGDDEVKEAGIYIVLYIFFLIFGTIVLTFYNNNFLYSLFEIASAQGNVGISLGVTSASLPVLSKITLIFNMWLGRLEILPVLLLFKAFSNSVFTLSKRINN